MTYGSDLEEHHPKDILNSSEKTVQNAVFEIHGAFRVEGERGEFARGQPLFVQPAQSRAVFEGFVEASAPFQRETRLAG